jgi:hypothetical protein
MLETIAVNVAEIKKDYDRGAVAILLDMAEYLKRSHEILKKEIVKYPNDPEIMVRLAQVEDIFIAVKHKINELVKLAGYKPIQINDAVEGVA